MLRRNLSTGLTEVNTLRLIMMTTIRLRSIWNIITNVQGVPFTLTSNITEDYLKESFLCLILYLKAYYCFGQGQETNMGLLKIIWVKVKECSFKDTLYIVLYLSIQHCLFELKLNLLSKLNFKCWWIIKLMRGVEMWLETTSLQSYSLLSAATPWLTWCVNTSRVERSQMRRKLEYRDTNRWQQLSPGPWQLTGIEKIFDIVDISFWQETSQRKCFFWCWVGLRKSIVSELFEKICYLSLSDTHSISCKQLIQETSDQEECQG